MERALRFSDAVIVEVSGARGPGEPVSGAASISKKFADVVSDIDKVVRPIVEKLQATMLEHVESYEVELEFSFTAEGSLFLCKVEGEASISVKVTIKAKP